MTSSLSNQAARSALRAMREGDRVLLDYHPGAAFGRAASSVHAAQAAVLHAIGDATTFDELVGACALAFRLQVHPKFCPSSPHSCCGWRVGRSTDALPWQVQHHLVGGLNPDNPDDAAQIRTVRQAVMDSIDRGFPVWYGDEEDGIVVGYQAGGAEWLCYHPEHDHGTKLHIEKGLTWGVHIFTEPKTPPPDRRRLAEAALRQAIMMWYVPTSGDSGRKDRMGRAAWAYWIEQFPTIPAEDRDGQYARQGNAWIYDSLVGCRRSAAVFLRQVAPEFPDAVAAHLRAAADVYDQMANRVLTDPAHDAVAIAPASGPWTDAQRADQLRRMRQAAELDGHAIAQIEAALLAL